MGENMKVFLISDTHFGDENIMKYEKRPFLTKDEMDDVMISRWNEIVSPNDVIFHLGDVGNYPFVKMKNIIQRLNGKKILVMGNHDRHFSVMEWMECGFSEVSQYPIIYNEYFVMQHEPPQYINDAMPYYYFYGHVHGTKMYESVTNQSACVCVERWEYGPVDLELIKERVLANE